MTNVGDGHSVYDTDTIGLTVVSMLDSLGLAQHLVLKIAFLLIAKISLD
jgi:hypothetical protein